MARTVVLITGCSSGIGMHLALRLASDPSRSFKVYATMRDLGAKGPLWEAAQSRGCPPGSLETLQLDVREADSLAAAQAQVTEGHVDVLVCNAAQGLMGPLEGLTASEVASVLDVNVAGTVRVLQAFLPDMKRRRSGHIFVTGSIGGLIGMPFLDVYSASKFALEGLCECLALQLLPFGIHVSLIECGPVHTPLMEKVSKSTGRALERGDTKTRELFAQFSRFMESTVQEFQQPEEVAELFVKALRDPHPALRYFSANTDSLLPLIRLRQDDPSGRSFLAAAHRLFLQEHDESNGAGSPAAPQ
ncbi:17-beta-hydroxysteroid dehydrogenase type 1 [Sorex araneus]|uniref:17-beta-hydroxysteroid dehydrogenase type 1 n=1 Tax=Sorex araneus TaxID=42254 RepID=UPI00243362A4|nr:17-beta-hydroxysteroid dehydrogenase type 1 [Sorex araneus]